MCCLVFRRSELYSPPRCLWSRSPCPSCIPGWGSAGLDDPIVGVDHPFPYAGVDALDDRVLLTTILHLKTSPSTSTHGALGGSPEVMRSQSPETRPPAIQGDLLEQAAFLERRFCSARETIDVDLNEALSMVLPPHQRFTTRCRFRRGLCIADAKHRRPAKERRPKAAYGCLSHKGWGKETLTGTSYPGISKYPSPALRKW